MSFCIFFFGVVLVVLKILQKVRGLENYTSDFNVSVSPRIYRLAAKLFAKTLWENSMSVQCAHAWFQETPRDVLATEHEHRKFTQSKRLKTWKHTQKLRDGAASIYFFYLLSLLKFNFHRLKLFAFVSYFFEI